MNNRIVVALLVSGTMMRADTVVLRNGSRVDGSFIGGDSRSVRLAVGSQVNTYNVNDVDRIEFTNPDAPPQQGFAQDPNRGRERAAAPSPSPYPAPNAAPPATGPAGLQVPAGTEITVRMIDPVNSETDRLGQTYRASIDEPVVVNGETVIPRGADCVATLVSSEQSGKIEGRTALTLDLKTVTVNGRSYEISTSSVTQASNSRGARSAKVIGGTAALGAIIGAIAGGGKGAAVGTVAGAGAGTAAQVATSGQKVRIPSETRLTFALQNPLNL